jgi:NAD(P)H-hydrate repair Nnr-like enzyme with NAD(P)H-hydrate epimerase domain
MMQFDPELVRLMRAALEEVMQRVPVEYSNQATKAYLAECILRTAGQGRTSFDALVTAAADHMPTIPNLFS